MCTRVEGIKINQQVNKSQDYVQKWKGQKIDSSAA